MNYPDRTKYLATTIRSWIEDGISYYQILRITELFAHVLVINRIPDLFALHVADPNRPIQIRWSNIRLDIFPGYLIWSRTSLTGRIIERSDSMECFDVNFLSYLRYVHR